MTATDTKPEVGFPVSAGEAFALAGWWTRYAIDRLQSDPRCSDPEVVTAVKSHATAALAQHAAVDQAIALIRRPAANADS